MGRTPGGGGGIFALALRLSVGGRHFENGDFRRKTMTTQSRDFPARAVHQTPILIAAFFKFFQLSVDGKHLTQLQPETFAFKFLRRAYCGWRSRLSSRDKQLASVVRAVYNALFS